MNRVVAETVLVGPHALLREGLARILSAANFRILGSATDIDDLIPSSLPQKQGILLVIDAGDDFDTALAQLTSFKQRHPTGRVAVLTHQRRLHEMVSAFQAGANVYLANVAACDTFVKSLELIILGVTLLPAEILNLISLQQERSLAPGRNGEVGHPIGDPYDNGSGRGDDRIGRIPEAKAGTNELVPCTMNSLAPLSTRQQCILRCLIQGDSNKNIARKLAITEATAKVHVKAILRKIRVHNRTQAAIWAMHTAPFMVADDVSPEQITGTAAAVPPGHDAVSITWRTESAQ